jgi:hypothetical protein
VRRASIGGRGARSVHVNSAFCFSCFYFEPSLCPRVSVCWLAPHTRARQIGIQLCLYVKTTRLQLCL